MPHPSWNDSYASGEPPPWDAGTPDPMLVEIIESRAIAPGRTLEISAQVWRRSVRLADRARASGVTVPLADLIIFSCARIHGLDVGHDDTHFDELAQLEA